MGTAVIEDEYIVQQHRNTQHQSECKFDDIFEFTICFCVVIYLTSRESQIVAKGELH